MCHCAVGYQLGPDKKSCEETGEAPVFIRVLVQIGGHQNDLCLEAEGVTTKGQVDLFSVKMTIFPLPPEQFSCGRTHMSTSSKSSVQRRSLTQKLEANRTFSGLLLGDNATDLFEYDNYADYASVNDSEPLDTPRIDARSRKTSSADEAGRNLTETFPEEELPYWAFPTLPTITEKGNTDKRIVGGDEAVPGEIPWQVRKNESGEAFSSPLVICFSSGHPGDPDVPLGGPADGGVLLWGVSAQRPVGHHRRPLPGE